VKPNIDGLSLQTAIEPWGVPPKPSGRLGEWSAYVLLFIMMCFPTMAHFLYARYFLVALLVALIGIRGLTTKLRLDRRVALWTLFLAAVSLSFGLRGLVLGAPGALMQMQVYAMWPLIYLVLMSGVDERILQGLERTLIRSGGFIAVFVACFVLTELSLIPKIFPFERLLSPEEESNGTFLAVAFGEGYVQLYVAGMSSLAFLVPFLFAAAASRSPRYDQRWVSRRWLLPVLFLNLPLLIFSGLRALQAVAMVAPLLTLAFGAFLPRAERQSLMKWLRRTILALAAVVIILVPLLSLLHTITFEAMADRFALAFDFSPSNRSDNAVGRVEQYFALMHGWEQAPFIGKGLGASAHESIRAGRTWGYELTYVDLLFQTGLVGFAAYAAGILWIYWTGIKIIRRGGAAGQFMLPALAGMSALLIVNSVDPYLRSFDTLWPVFLPLAFINNWLITNREKRINNLASAQGRGGLATGAPPEG